MEINYYRDLRILPDLALVELASSCFKQIEINHSELNGYFDKVISELSKRNQDLIELAFKKSINYSESELISGFDRKNKSNLKFKEIEFVDSKINVSSKLNSIALMKVSGESMIDSNMNSGDLILIERNTQILNNDIIVININGINFVKRFIQDEEGKITLVSSNPEYPDFVMNNNYKYKIIGKVIKIIRHIK
jgi:hypothetical protein